MGIFDSGELFTMYHARLQMRSQLMGGIPKDPHVIEQWIRSKAGVTDEQEITAMMIRTLYELGIDVPDDATTEQVIEASKQLAGKAAVGFKRDEQGLYIEGRQVKAMLKECVNIIYSGSEGWANPRAKKKADTGEALYRKAPRNFTAERAFVNPERLHLGVMEPAGVELVIGHVIGPQGPRSTLTYYEYVERPAIEFAVMVTDDAIPQDAWPLIWVQAQEIGLGAVRSQGNGRFDIEGWDRFTPAEVVAFQARIQQEQPPGEAEPAA